MASSFPDSGLLYLGSSEVLSSPDALGNTATPLSAHAGPCQQLKEAISLYRTLLPELKAAAGAPGDVMTQADAELKGIRREADALLK